MEEDRDEIIEVSDMTSGYNDGQTNARGDGYQMVLKQIPESNVPRSSNLTTQMATEDPSMRIIMTIFVVVIVMFVAIFAILCLIRNNV